MTQLAMSLPVSPGEKGNYHVKRPGMLIVLLREVNHRLLASLLFRMFRMKHHYF